MFFSACRAAPDGRAKEEAPGGTNQAVSHLLMQRGNDTLCSQSIHKRFSPKDHTWDGQRDLKQSHRQTPAAVQRSFTKFYAGHSGAALVPSHTAIALAMRESKGKIKVFNGKSCASLNKASQSCQGARAYRRAAISPSFLPKKLSTSS